MVKETKVPPAVSGSQKRSYRSSAEPLPGHVQREASEKARARLLRAIKRKTRVGGVVNWTAVMSLVASKMRIQHDVIS